MTAQRITPAMWERMAWHPKARVIAQLDRENRDMARGYTTEQRAQLRDLTARAKKARDFLEAAEAEIAHLSKVVEIAEAADDAAQGPSRLAAATAEALGDREPARRPERRNAEYRAAEAARKRQARSMEKAS